MTVIVLIIVLAALALLAGATLLLRPRLRRRSAGARPAEPARPDGGAAGPQAESTPGTGPGAAAGNVLGTAAGILRPATVPPAVPAEPSPVPLAGRMARLRGRLARAQTGFGSVVLGLLSRPGLDDRGWEQIEDTLIAADLGVGPARQLVAELRTQVRVAGAQGPDAVRELLRRELVSQLGPGMDRSLHLTGHGARPAVALVVGVNGTGKTTVCGKLARALIAEGQTVLLGAADTFRAAAADQLATWGERVGARVVRAERAGADPASVAFAAVAQAIADRVDCVIVDTGGRLHTKTGLMDELGKIKRVVARQAGVDEVLLVLDATTGQNGLRQARVFAEVVDITGIVLTKLDGTAKGGIVVAVQRELGVPVKLVGLGEGPDDLAPFDPAVFADAVLG
jgi:fused signal recognition particle receptor